MTLRLSALLTNSFSDVTDRLMLECLSVESDRLTDGSQQNEKDKLNLKLQFTV